MNQAAPGAFSEGQILVGKYRVERVLGQGGMGVVLAARHIHLEERVAIKLMLAEAAFSAEAVARFVREARAAARLESAHVAKVSDVGTLEDGRPYMVMEYLDGQDLSQVLQTSGVLGVQDAVDYVLQAGEAIAEAHSIGIIHRDLKPSNLFLTRRRDRTPHVKVLDFGISKVSGSSMKASDNAMTKTSAMMGSPLYMSPEQMTSVRDVDARSDIWALGIILFELLTGSPPFIGETLPQVCGLVIQSPDPPASSRRPDLPPELDALIHRCLAKNPADRFQNVAELALALQPFAGRYGRASVERIVLLSGGPEPASLPRTTATAPINEAASQAATGQAVQGTHAAWGETRPPVPSKRSNGWLVLPLLGVPSLAAAAWFFVVKPAAEGTGPEASSSVVSAAEPPVAPPPESVLPPPVESPPSASLAPPPSAAPPAGRVAPAPAAAATPRSQAAARKPPLAAAAVPSKPASAAPAVAAPAPAVATPAPAVATPASAAPPKPAAGEVKKPSGMGGRL
jgi:serine/threonine-protein kinase